MTNDKIIFPESVDKDSMEASAGILKNLAERSIVSNSNAFLELIKNSFDEDASFSNINLVYENGLISYITVEDDGAGFSREGYSSFRHIGNSNKTRNSKTTKERFVTGMNGSGAYASIKLGDYLRIDSYNSNQEFSLSKEIDWSYVYSSPEKNVEDLKFTSITNSNYFFQSSGTRLLIKKLRTEILIKQIEIDLLYPTIWSGFEINIFDNNSKINTFNLKEEMDKIKKYDFVFDSVIFEYKKWRDL